MEARSTLRENEFGATMVEYALLVALISLVGSAGIQVLGENVLSKYGDIATQVDAAGTSQGQNP